MVSFQVCSFQFCGELVIGPLCDCMGVCTRMVGGGGGGEVGVGVGGEETGGLAVLYLMDIKGG